LYNDVIFVYTVFHVDPASGLPNTINVSVCVKREISEFKDELCENAWNGTSFIQRHLR